MAGCCEYGAEPAGSIIFWEYFDQVGTGSFQSRKVFQGASVDSWIHLFLTRAHESSYSPSSGVCLPELRRQGREAYQSPLSKAKLRMSGALLPLPI